MAATEIDTPTERELLALVKQDPIAPVVPEVGSSTMRSPSGDWSSIIPISEAGLIVFRSVSRAVSRFAL